MRVWGVMSHKAACAIDTVQGGLVGHRHTKYKRQLSGQSVQTHIHSILHRPNLGLLMVTISSVGMRVWGANTPLHRHDSRLNLP